MNIVQALEILEQEVESVGDKFLTLGAILAPVRTTDDRADSPWCPVANEEPRSDACRRIICTADAVSRLRARMCDLIDELDLPLHGEPKPASTQPVYAKLKPISSDRACV